MKQTDFAKTLARFLTDYLPGQRNVSTNTIKSYRDALKQLLLFMQTDQGIKPECICFASLGMLQVKKFLSWLETEKMVSVNTRNQRLAALHSFFRYAQTEYPEVLFESQKILGIPFKKKHQPVISHLSKEQLGFLFAQPDCSTSKGRRDLALMVTLYDTGARVQELIDLKVCDLRLTQPAVITLTGKGNKQRNVPVLAKSQNLLENYLKENHLLNKGRELSPLFHNYNLQAFTRPGITYILKKYYRMAKLAHPKVVFPDNLHAHMLRHSKAFHLLEAGVNLIYIRDLLGHVSITTTEMYLKYDTELKRKALEAAYPSVVFQDVPAWEDNTEILSWLHNLCRS